MIKYLSLLIILSGFFRQMEARNKLSAHGGINYLEVSNKNSIDPDVVVRIIVAFGYKYSVDDLGRSIMPEINFSQEGFKNKQFGYLFISLLSGSILHQPLICQLVF